MSSGLHTDDARLVEDFRGLDLKTVPSQILETQVQGLMNSGRLMAGIASGLAYGAPLFVNGEQVGRTPGLIPDDVFQASRRTFKLIRFITTGIFHPRFSAGLRHGLYKELSGYGPLLVSLLDGTLLNMFFDLAQNVNEQPELAHRLGEQIGGSMVKNVLDKADKEDYGEFVFAVGALLGPLIIDLIGLLVSGGAGPLAKRGLAVTAGMSADALGLAADIKRLSGDRLIEMRRLAQNAADALQHGDLTPVPAGGPAILPGLPTRASREVAEGAFLSQADDASSSIGKAARGLESGSGLAPNGTRVNPSALPDAPPARFSGAAGAAGGAATSGARTGARTVGVHASLKAGNEASSQAIRLATHEPQLPLHWDRIFNLLDGPLRSGPNNKPVPILDLLSKDFAPEMGPMLRVLQHRESGFDFGAGVSEDLIPHLARASDYHGLGTITKLDAAILREFSHDRAIAGFKKSYQAVRSQVSAILRPRSFRVGRDMRFNNNPPWPQLRAEARQILDEMVRHGFIGEQSIAYHMGHLFGPGMGAEAHAGAGLIPGFVNIRLQSGAIANSVIGRASARDARKGSSALAEEVGSYRWDQVGTEGSMMDLALTAKEAAKKGRLNEIIGLDTFAETWGDELLNTAFFRIAAELGLTTLKPQHFTRAVEYRMSVFSLDSKAGFPTLSEVASRWNLRIELHPPPVGKADVYSMGRFAGALDDVAHRTFDRDTLRRPKNRNMNSN